MEEKKSGRYPWNSDEDNDKVAEEEMSEEEKRLNQLLSDVEDICGRLYTTGSWDSISDADLIKIGAVSTFLLCTARQEYEDRIGLEQIEEDVFGCLIGEELENVGLLDD